MYELSKKDVSYTVTSILSFRNKDEVYVKYKTLLMYKNISGAFLKIFLET